jgi:hypothetical protein
MPGVRYGPDIADDAAYIYKGIVDLNKKEQSLKRAAQAAQKAGKKVKAAKLNKRDQQKYDRFAAMATDIFGVTKRDLKKGNYGDLYKMQQYSPDGITKKGAKSRRAKIAKNKRTGKVKLKRDVKESSDRSGGTTTRRAGQGSSYIGLTKTKQYTDIKKRAFERMAKRGGVRVGTGKKKRVTNEEGLDRLQIAKRATPSGINKSGGVKSPMKGLRPPIVKRPRAAASAKRAKTAQSKTKKTVKSGGKKRSTTRKK